MICIRAHPSDRHFAELVAQLAVIGWRLIAPREWSKSQGGVDPRLWVNNQGYVNLRRAGGETGTYHERPK